MPRLLALGDSYTIGESVAPEARWPEQWAAAMAAAGHGIERPVRVIAQTGWTTDELEAEIARQMPLGQWDLVSLLVGVNNQYRGRPLDEYRSPFDALLETTIELARGRLPRHHRTDPRAQPRSGHARRRRPASLGGHVPAVGRGFTLHWKVR